MDNDTIKKDLYKNINKSINNFSYAKSLAFNSNKYDLYTSQNINRVNERNKNNINDINLNLVGKTFNHLLFNPSMNSKIKNSYNLNNANNHFNSSNVLFNNFRGNENNKNGEERSNNFYAIKRPLDKQKQLFKKRKPTEEVKPIILKDYSEKNSLKNISKGEEEEVTIVNNTENTILDENEELIGRNVPH